MVTLKNLQQSNKLIDTHTHLYLKQFNEDIDDVISRALSVGVNRFYMPSINSSYNKQMLQLMSRYPKNIFCMVGLHPCYVDENYKKELDFVRDEIERNKYYAIGEIGIDLFRSSKNFNNQADALRIQCSIAIKNNLPIVIHTRNSVNETIEIISEFKKQNLRGVFHCFVGNFIQAKKIIDFIKNA